MKELGEINIFIETPGIPQSIHSTREKLSACWAVRHWSINLLSGGSMNVDLVTYTH